MAAVERLARSDRRLAATAEQWDADPWLLNTPKGVVDLRTGSMRAHRAGDYHHPHDGGRAQRERMPAVAQLPRTRHRRRRGAARISATDVRLRLTGVTTEHALVLPLRQRRQRQGHLRQGDAPASSATITAPRRSRPSPPPQRAASDRARRAARRPAGDRDRDRGRPALGRSQDQDADRRRPIAARFMRQDFFDYLPQFKLMIAGNHKPGLRSVDEAIRRRFNLIPFTVTIPAEERDKDLGDKLKAEWPGILQWMIDGCVDWQERGLAPPEVVTAATAAYLEAQDSIAAWLDECCELRCQHLGAFTDAVRKLEGMGRAFRPLRRRHQDLPRPPRWPRWHQTQARTGHQARWLPRRAPQATGAAAGGPVLREVTITENLWAREREL